MKKITITNAYTWYNKGDAGILLGIVESLKKLYNNDVEIDVLSFTPEEDEKKYDEERCIKRFYSNVLNPYPYKHTKLGRILAIIKLFFNMIYQLLMINISKKQLIKKNKSYKSINDCDYIVVCGGGFLGGNKFNSFIHLFQIYVNTKFNKKVIIMGTSIEPISNKIVKLCTERILKKVDYIYAREIITFNYLKEFLPEEKFTLIPDMAFMLQDIKEDDEIISSIKSKFSISYGITVRKWLFPSRNNSKKIFDNYKKELANFIEYRAEKDNAVFIFIPQVIVSHGNDADIAREIKNMLKKEYRDNFVILENDVHPTEIKRMIWNLDYFIGTRMHSNIFATSMGIPTIAIAYEKKTNGIMHTLKLDDYVLEMDNLTFDDLIDKSNIQKEKDEEIRNDLKKQILNIRKEILKKIEKVLMEL